MEQRIAALEQQVDKLVQTIQVYSAVINVLASKIGVSNEEVKANLAANGIKISPSVVGESTEQPDNSGNQSDGNTGVSGSAG